MTAEKITDRVRKLFAKADSTTSDHERDALMAKAYKLLAQHGIDEALARAGAGTDASEIGRFDFAPAGRYRNDQVHLVGAVADALHCTAVHSPQEGRVMIYGVRRHLDRVEMLAGVLVSHMIATAGRARPEDPFTPTITYRKSVMYGFMATVAERLREAEGEAVRESGDATGAEVVLLSDAQRAAAALAEAHPAVQQGAALRRSAAGYAAGAEAANRVDLGGGNRVAGRAAIGA